MTRHRTVPTVRASVSVICSRNVMAFWGFFLCSVIRRMMKYLENITHLMTRYLEGSQPHLSPNSVTCLTLFFCGESLSAIWLAKETELGLDSGCPTTCGARYISLSCIE